MKKQYQYILVILTLIIVYELYLIFSFKYIDIQKDIIISNIDSNIASLKTTLENKKDYFAHINTIAYKDKVAKSSQNKKNPGEEVIFIVTKDDVEQYKKIDVDEQIYSEKVIKSPTYWMSNIEKWYYYVFNKDLNNN